MDKFELMAEALVNAISVRVERTLAPLAKRLDDLERRGYITKEDVAVIRGEQGERGVPGERGEPGQSMHADSVRLMIVEEVGKAIGILPRAQDGKSVTVDEVRPVLEEMVRLSVGAIPKPRDGTDGNHGADGLNGKDADPQVVRAMVVEEVRTAVDALPPPAKGEKGEAGTIGPRGAPGEKGDSVVGQKGESGERGEKGDKGDTGERGERGESGEMGVKGERGEKGEHGDVVHPDTLRVMLGELVETAVKKIPVPERGEPGQSVDMQEVARLVHEDVQRGLDAIRPLIKGEPGEPGDGLRDMSMDIKEDGRTLVFRFIGAAFEKSVEVIAPWQIYRGVWKAGAYQKGDVVTYAGSSWTALADTQETPGKSQDWQLSVKKGRDGRE